MAGEEVGGEVVMAGEEVGRGVAGVVVGSVVGGRKVLSWGVVVGEVVLVVLRGFHLHVWKLLVSLMYNQSVYSNGTWDYVHIRAGH